MKDYPIETIKKSKSLEGIATQLAEIATLPKGYDAVKLQEAIDKANGVLQLPPGNFILDGSGTELLLVKKPIKIKGSGHNTKLIIKSTVPNTTDVLRISPLAGPTGKTLYSIEDLQIIPESGTPGRHAVHLDVTNAGQYISKFTIQNVVVNQLGGKALKLTNPTNVDGFFTSEIANNLFYGGMDLERLGDSVNIYHNTLTGNNIGIDVSHVAGAAMTIIENNNFTSKGGAIRVKSGDQVKILRNQIEQFYPYEGVDNACIAIGTEATVGMSEIVGNNINGHVTNVDHVIKLDRCAYADVNHNRMYKGSLEVINVTANSNRAFIGRKNFYINNNSEIKPSIKDEGNGTAGVEKAIVLQNGWNDYDTANYGSPYFYKNNEGEVRLMGAIKSGTVTAGTILFTLPVNFRPQKIRYFKVYSESAGASVEGLIQILPTGEVRIQKGGASLLNFNDISFLSY